MAVGEWKYLSEYKQLRVCKFSCKSGYIINIYFLQFKLLKILKWIQSQYYYRDRRIPNLHEESFFEQW